jgi:hypothetical protein
MPYSWGHLIGIEVNDFPDNVQDNLSVFVIHDSSLFIICYYPPTGAFAGSKNFWQI